MLVCPASTLEQNGLWQYSSAFAHPDPPPHRGIHWRHRGLAWAPPVGHTGRKTPLSPAPCWARPPPQIQSENSAGNPPQSPGHSSGWHKRHKQHLVSPQTWPWSGDVGLVAVRESLYAMLTQVYWQQRCLFLKVAKPKQPGGKILKKLMLHWTIQRAKWEPYHRYTMFQRLNKITFSLKAVHGSYWWEKSCVRVSKIRPLPKILSLLSLASRPDHVLQTATSDWGQWKTTGTQVEVLSFTCGLYVSFSLDWTTSSIPKMSGHRVKRKIKQGVIIC